MPRAVGRFQTRVVYWLSETSQLSGIIRSKGYSGSGLCIWSKNQSFCSSRSRSSSPNSRYDGYMDCQPSAPGGVSRSKGLRKDRRPCVMPAPLPQLAAVSASPPGTASAVAAQTTAAYAQVDHDERPGPKKEPQPSVTTYP